MNNWRSRRTGTSGTVVLPGTNRAADRFARASFYINAIPQVEDREDALASVLSVVRNTSVPFGLSTPDQPNISSTRWRTLTDHKSLTYYYDSATAIGGCWVALADLDLSEGAPVKRLDLAALQASGQTGDVASRFVDSAPIAFAGL